MIIWKGYGFLVVVIALVIGALFTLISSGIGFAEDLGAALGVMISGVVIWFVGLRFNAPEAARTFINKKTGQEVTVKPDHSFFFIKMQYWAFIIGGIGLIMLIGILLNGKSPF